VERKPGLFESAITVTDGDLALQGSYIDGDVYASGEILNEDTVVTGTSTANGTEEFDLLNTEPYKTEAQNGGIIEGNLVLGAGTHNLGPVYITGYLKIADGADVTLGGCVYVEGSQKMAIPSGGPETYSIHIEHGTSLAGTGDFIAEDGDIKIEIAVIEIDDVPLIAAMTGNIKVENCGYIKGLLYTPEGEVDLEENIEIYGAIHAQNMSMMQNCTISYPQDAEGCDLLGPSDPTILTWQIS